MNTVKDSTARFNNRIKELLIETSISNLSEEELLKAVASLSEKLGESLTLLYEG